MLSQVKDIGHTAEEKSKAVDEAKDRAERADKAQKVAEAAAKHAAQQVAQLIDGNKLPTGKTS